MNKETSQLQLHQHFLSFFLPEGILELFELVWMETQSLDSRESKKDILYTSALHIYLDERDNLPEDMQNLRPNGFTEETIFNDFPVRDKKVILDLSESMTDIVTQAFPNAAFTLTWMLRHHPPVRKVI